jgi:hypothetical protein
LFDLPQNTSTPIPPEGSKKEVISRQGCGEIKKVSPRLQQKNLAVDEYSPFAVVLST